jgi:hypothetical protein
MGGQPWIYWVPYQPDINLALHSLRQREFAAGRYNPVIAFPEFPGTAAASGPGHSSIEEALAAANESGTRSILDMQSIGSTPGYGIVTSMSPHRLIELFGTEHPSRSMIEANMDFLCDIERGHGVYIVVYADNHPEQILFAGYSYD